jgi:CheY-like chemotaxis protein/anti-sigma regulatory factor (Ser/Thr protein kinase)
VKHTILAIDDEAPNRLLIEAYLEGQNHSIICFSGASEAMSYLQAGGPADAILLDRMMPGVDGLSFLRAFKALPSFGLVPVIMQTAAAYPVQIAEGIAAGAYYYLTKPYSREVLLAVLSRALADYAHLRERNEAATRLRVLATRVEAIELSFRSLDEIRDIAGFLSLLYPDPREVILGIRELMLNAIEHGTLGIGYDEKTVLIRQARWEQEIERRLALPENLAKSASVKLCRDGSAIELTVEDGGPGFDWNRYMVFEPSRARDTHGRGIAMSRLMSFDDVTYVGRGNRVTCVKRR